ncbi:MAG: hypothetical protein BWX79_03175 [Alphaproteobacteria bacterium ADurb.Bin100]|nr:MAG: hypothetical protein BWX79_03175 [Alphaproteobacteria bacterium ADurb.Bin100]
MAHGHLQHGLAAGQAQHRAAGVAKGGDEVDELGLVLDDQLLQLIGLHAVAVDRRADQLSAVQPEALDGGQEGGALDDDLVTGGNQRLAQQVQRLLAAGGDDEVLGCHGGAALARHEGGELLSQRAVALGGTVLQRAAGLFGECGIDGGSDTVDVEHRAVGEAAGKADDAGLAQQLEEFADGGGFDVVQAVGKLEGHGVGPAGRGNEFDVRAF